MDRLTKFWGNGEYGLINAFKTTNAEVCNTLGRYEDEEERREEGCGFCNGYMVLAFEGGYELTCRTENGTPAIVDKDKEIAVDLSESFSFCPNCGRKLVDQ